MEEILMWAALKKAVAGVTESLGMEMPGLPSDLGAVGDACLLYTYPSPRD